MVQDRGWNRRNVDGGLSSSGRLASRQGRKKSANVATLTGYRSQVQGVSTMARAKQVSKRNRRKIALPAWGAAGMSLAMAGGASAGVAPAADTSAKRTALPSTVTLGEEELSDVSLSKFFVYDREATASSRLGVQYAQRCGGRCGGGAGRCGRRRPMRRRMCRARLRRPMRRRMCRGPMPVRRRRRMRRGPPMRRLRSGILCRLQLRLLPLVGRLPALLGSSAFRLR